MKSTVQAPDGGFITIEHPDGASQDEIIAFAQANYKPTPARIGAEGLPQAAKEVGETQGLVGQIGAGLGSAGQRMATALGQINPVAQIAQRLIGGDVPLMFRGMNLGSIPLAGASPESLEVAKATKQGAGNISTAADILGSIAMTAGVPANALSRGLTPASSVLGTMGTAGLMAGLTTPGGALERGKDAALSTVLAGVIPGITAVAQTGRRATTQAGRELGRAEVLRREIGEEAADALPGQLRAPYPNAPLGVTPTAAMKTQNPTLQALELGARTKRPDLFTPTDEANSIKRWQALQGVAKDESSLYAAEAARDRITKGLRQEALDLASQKQGFEIPIAKTVAAIAQGDSRSNPSVKALTKYVMDELEQGVTPGQLYTIRKTLTDAIPHGTELGNAVKQARVERMTVVNAIDDALDKASDGAWGLYLKAYGGFSQSVTSMKAGQAMADIFQHSPARTSASTGSVPLMSPAALSRGLEKFGEKQFGSKTIPRITPEERKTVEMVIDDLQRQQSVMRAGGILGSDTAAKFAAGSRGEAVGAGLLGMAADRVLPGSGLLSGPISRGLARKREEALAEILRDPEKLAQALEAAQRAQALRVASGIPSIGIRAGGYE